MSNRAGQSAPNSFSAHGRPRRIAAPASDESRRVFTATQRHKRKRGGEFRLLTAAGAKESEGAPSQENIHSLARRYKLFHSVRSPCFPGECRRVAQAFANSTGRHSAAGCRAFARSSPAERAPATWATAFPLVRLAGRALTRAALSYANHATMCAPGEQVSGRAPSIMRRDGSAPRTRRPANGLPAPPGPENSPSHDQAHNGRS